MSDVFYKLRKTQILGDLKVSSDGTIILEELDTDTVITNPVEGEYKLYMKDADLLLLDSTGTATSILTGQTSSNVSTFVIDNKNDLPSLIIPLYIYPSDIYTNTVYNNFIRLLKRHTLVNTCVVLNPGSGPGVGVDANYAVAVRRLNGAGAIVTGYINCVYGTRVLSEIYTDIDNWVTFYGANGLKGFFLDEAETNPSNYDYYKSIVSYVNSKGIKFTIANPGAQANRLFYDDKIFDVVIEFENSLAGTGFVNDDALITWVENNSTGAFEGSNADYYYKTRGFLLHGQNSISYTLLDSITSNYGWVYVTDDVMPNPWDTLPSYLDKLYEYASGVLSESSIEDQALALSIALG